MANDTIGSRIKMFRKYNGLTQEELALKSGISVMSIRRYEADERIPKYEIMEKIAKTLQVDSDCIFFNIEELKAEVRGLKIAQQKMIEKDLLTYFERLNLTGKSVAVERIHELTKIEDYTKEDPAE